MAIKGCGASFYLGANAVAELNSVSNAITGETLDVTTFDSSCLKEFIAGIRSGTMDISGFYDPTDATGQAAMFTALLAGTTLTTTQQPKILYDATNGFSADGVISSLSTSASVDGTVEFSASIQLTGTITVEIAVETA